LSACLRQQNTREQGSSLGSSTTGTRSFHISQAVTSSTTTVSNNYKKKKKAFCFNFALGLMHERVKKREASTF
jgi:hypothetical protein